jgi:tRNA nucleotidyltransferase (CCA-adding enzyme)
VFVGVVTRQEVDAAQRHGLGARPVAEISSRAPRWVAPDAPLQGVREALLEGTHRLVLVGTPPGDARGVITRTSLFRAWARELPQARHERPPPPDSTVGRLRRALGPTWSRLVEVGDAAARLGMSAWLVGGSVRDFLLDLPVRDVDVVVEGDGRAVARATREVIGGRLHVHDLFATATIALDDGPSIDLATARTEYYRAPAALPEVVHAGLRQDLFRRDFTINAVAIALGPSERGVIQDPFGGLGDLKHGLLRVLHGLSFHDDPSRAWRAARFAARFDFRVTPETEGLLLAARRTGVFERLPLDRAGRELHLILSEDEVVQSFRLLRDWGLLATVHAAFGADRVLLDELLAVAAARQRFAGVHGGEVVVPEQADVLWLVVASRVPVGDREARAALLPWPRRQMRHWVDGPERVDGALGRLARASSGSTAGRILERLDSCERIYAAGVCADPRASEWLAWWEREGRLVASAVDGARLEAAGYAPGPAFGPALAAALDAARDGADAAAQLVAARAVMMQMAQQEEVAPTRRASPRRRTSER